LHDISPIEFLLVVIRAVLTPIRADTAAASQPACPPPMTTTSKLSMHEMYIEGINLQESINIIDKPFIYFPMQKSLNIFPKTSSTPIKPTISPRKLEEILSSSATFSISLDFEIRK